MIKLYLDFYKGESHENKTGAELVSVIDIDKGVKPRQEVTCEIKYQDGANLYWQKGQLDSLQWMLQGESHEKRETPFKA